MTTIEELKHKIATVDDLKSVIKTMKALAAVSIRQYEKAVESLTEYDRTLEKGWQILLKNNPELLIKKSPQTTQSWGLVVFGSDWGMCGQFNERIAEYTHDYLNSLSERPRRKSGQTPRRFPPQGNADQESDATLLLRKQLRKAHQDKTDGAYEFRRATTESAPWLPLTSSKIALENPSFQELS